MLNIPHKILSIFWIGISMFLLTTNVSAQDPAIFDDKMYFKGFVNKYQEVPKEILIEMIKDDTLTDFKTAAAVNVFKEKHSSATVAREKKRVKKILIKRFKDTRSPFVQVEIMATLVRMDRYEYFKAFVPALISKMNHYNEVINEMAFDNLNYIIKEGSDRPREARIVFNTLRKIFFLMRKRLAPIKQPNKKLSHKLIILRWSVKVLGNDSLKKLPKEVLNLL